MRLKVNYLLAFAHWASGCLYSFGVGPCRNNCVLSAINQNTALCAEERAYGSNNMKFPNLSLVAHHAILTEFDSASSFWREVILKNLDSIAQAAFRKRATLSCISY
ncbi:hypothetical protein SprV_0902795500 [Sparganum proliferum]